MRIRIDIYSILAVFNPSNLLLANRIISRLKLGKFHANQQISLLIVKQFSMILYFH